MTAQNRSTNQCLVSSNSWTELSPSAIYWIPLAADQIATIAVMEMIPTERLYTSSVIEIKKAEMMDLLKNEKEYVILKELYNSL